MLLIHPLPGSPAADVDVAVIRVTRKPVAAALEFLVQFIEYDVRQHGREWTALRRSLDARTDQPILHYPCFEERSQQGQQPFVADPLGDPRQQSVVVDPVEEPFEIQIHHPAVAFGLILLRLLHRLVRRSLGSEPIAVH
jgi:hypothetical protein